MNAATRVVAVSHMTKKIIEHRYGIDFRVSLADLIVRNTDVAPRSWFPILRNAAMTSAWFSVRFMSHSGRGRAGGPANGSHGSSARAHAGSRPVRFPAAIGGLGAATG